MSRALVRLLTTLVVVAHKRPAVAQEENAMKIVKQRHITWSLINDVEVNETRWCSIPTHTTNFPDVTPARSQQQNDTSIPTSGTQHGTFVEDKTWRPTFLMHTTNAEPAPAAKSVRDKVARRSPRVPSSPRAPTGALFYLQHVRSCASATRSRRGPTSASISVPVLPETTAIDLSNTPAAIGGANPPRISTYWGFQSPSIPTTAPKCWNCRGGGRSDDEDDYGLDIEGLSQEGDSPTLTSTRRRMVSRTVRSPQTTHGNLAREEKVGGHHWRALEPNLRQKTSTLSKHMLTSEVP